jgi:hypothetical protein
MSRGIIGGIVGLAVAALTTTAYLVTTSRLEARIVKDVKQRVLNAQDLLIQNSSLEMLGLQTRVEAAARNETFLEALKVEQPGDREQIANQAFRRFLAELGEGDPRPDFMALTDRDGNLVALLDVSRPAPDSWKGDDDKLIYPAVALALEQRQIISSVWDYRQLRALMKVGVAPIINDLDEVGGAIVLAYSLSSKEAVQQEGLLGLDVAYFYRDTVHATSFTVNGKEDTRKQASLATKLFASGFAARAMERGVADEVIEISLDGESYLATAGQLRQFTSKPLPPGYPRPEAGAAVLMSLSEALDPLFTVRMTIGLLGIGALIIALLAIALTARAILHPLDHIELGINDIINGNIDRVFQPVSPDLDGLANALNVMLARLLGRPEPGDEEYDDDGNVIGSAGGVAFSSESLSAKNAEAIKLAQEPEDDYLKRLYDEYLEARRTAGEDVSGMSFDGFVAKVRLTEANLKKKYESRAVRFKVVVQDDKVTLKPVPIS